MFNLLYVCVVSTSQMWLPNQQEEKNTSSMYAGEIKAVLFMLLVFVWWVEFETFLGQPPRTFQFLSLQYV